MDVGKLAVDRKVIDGQAPEQNRILTVGSKATATISDAVDTRGPLAATALSSSGDGTTMVARVYPADKKVDFGDKSFR